MLKPTTEKILCFKSALCHTIVLIMVLLSFNTAVTCLFVEQAAADADETPEARISVLPATRLVVPSLNEIEYQSP